MPQKTWAVGEEVLAADFNTYVQNQVVPQFPTTAARDAAWVAPPDGAVCVTTDKGAVWRRKAGAWLRIDIWSQRAPQSPLIGTDTGGPVLLWTNNYSITTDTSGDALVIAASSIPGQCVLGAHLTGSDIYGLVGAFRNAGGNLFVRIYNGGTPVVSSGAVVNIVVYIAS